LGLPLRAIVTSGNCSDGPFLPKLIDDLEADCVLANAGYCSKRNFQTVTSMGAVAFIADNPRKKGKDCKMESSKRLKEERYVIEQFNGHLKANLLKIVGFDQKDFLKKTAMATAGLIGYNVEAIRALIVGDKSLKTVSKYWT
jgi:hypothetical protein